MTGFRFGPRTGTQGPRVGLLLCCLSLVFAFLSSGWLTSLLVLLPWLCLLVDVSFSSAWLTSLLGLLLLLAVLLVLPSLVLLLGAAADLLLFFFLSSGEDLFADWLRSRGSKVFLISLGEDLLTDRLRSRRGSASGLDRLVARGRAELESFMGEREEP